MSQHFVENVENRQHVHPEAVFKLATGCSGKQQPRLDDEFEDVLQRAKALLDGLLLVGGINPIGTVLDTREQTPARCITRIRHFFVKYLQKTSRGAMLSLIHI